MDFNREMMTNANTHLATNLLQVRSGIFNWMLEGAKRLKANQAFTYTSNSLSWRKHTMLVLILIKEFLTDCCMVSTSNDEIITVDHVMASLQDLESI